MAINMYNSTTISPPSEIYQNSSHRAMPEQKKTARSLLNQCIEESHSRHGGYSPERFLHPLSAGTQCPDSGMGIGESRLHNEAKTG
jgi:hypothetical protein